MHAFNTLLCERNQRCEVRSHLNNENENNIKDLLSKGALNGVVSQPLRPNDKYPNGDKNHLIKDTQVKAPEFQKRTFLGGSSTKN